MAVVICICWFFISWCSLHRWPNCDRWCSGEVWPRILKKTSSWSHLKKYYYYYRSRPLVLGPWPTILHRSSSRTASSIVRSSQSSVYHPLLMMMMMMMMMWAHALTPFCFCVLSPLSSRFGNVKNVNHGQIGDVRVCQVKCPHHLRVTKTACFTGTRLGG
jgi:hypothetical protein